jgi:hypothetical protein
MSGVRVSVVATGWRAGQFHLPLLLDDRIRASRRSSIPTQSACVQPPTGSPCNTRSPTRPTC